ncbi:MAG TPA: DUF6351 family protein [Mycobacteriales bacterium]|nr:DUF6351 family protein [Mycobacteriales bacterium]
MAASPVRLMAIALVPALLAVGSTAFGAARPHATARSQQVVITVLSGRADLVSGGQALVAVSPAADAKRLTVTVDGRDVTGSFAVRRGGLLAGRYAGLVRGLHVGGNVVRATLPDGSGARLLLTDHPNGGPLFAGPQPQPWTCQPGARDRKCDAPTRVHYKYVSTNPAKIGFQPYNVGKPPADVAMTTTDQGAKVPFVVRIETGYMDRDQFQIASLYQFGKPWTPFRPQAGWDHKLLIFHGASCAAQYEPSTAPDVTGSSNPTSAVGQLALGRGYMTMSTALDNSGHDCNVAIQAESLVMAKQYIATHFGLIRYTIGTGCSGGSLAVQWVANAYPGVYQGILPTCSFPDAMTSATQVADYALLERYWLTLTGNSAIRGVVWSPTQFGAVEGNLLPVDALTSVGCLSVAAPYTPGKCPTGYLSGAVPYFPCAGTTDATRYNATTNPGGARCSLFQLDKNLLGLRPRRLWSAAERKIGRGFANMPLDNVGVQYGLGALQHGEISAAQFADLNAHIGGVNIDLSWVPQRLRATRTSLANAYRTGLINETNNLNQTAIIDCRGPDPGAAHDAYRAFAIRARLDREHGTHANQLIWEGAEPIFGDAACERNAFIGMDRWLSAVAADHGNRSLPAKIIADKPADLTDECWDGAGTLLWHSLCGPDVVPVYGTARMVAGDPITTDNNKCQLEPLDRSSYTVTVAGITTPVSFTKSEWAELRRAFPTGVCNFAKPGVEQQPTIPWQTYQRADGRVIYGGRPLGPPPVSTPIGS